MARTIDAELVLDAGAELGEGPAWDATYKRLIWVDILRASVHELRPAGNGFATRTWKLSQHVGAAVPRADGSMALAVRDGFALLDTGGRERTLAQVEAGLDGNRMNDGKCDPQGRFWAGTMAYDEDEVAAGALYRLEHDGSVRTVLTGISISNGLGWSPDGATMYHIDTPSYQVCAYDFDGVDGSMNNSRTLISLTEQDGKPDGMTVDDEGHLWIALFGGGEVRRYTPDGDFDAVIPIPASQVTSCAFGGAARDELFITTAAVGVGQQEPLAGGLYRAHPGVTGPPATPYAG